MDELLVKYLLKETTATEEQAVQEWLRQNEDNRRYFEHFKLIWEKSRSLAASSTVNENEAWERFKNKRDYAGQGNTLAFKPARRSRMIKIAAAVALLVLGSSVIYYLGTFNNEVMMASANEVLTDTLPDGSVITLNKNSSLAYAKSFNRKERKVMLTGEAFFDVAPNKQKPFEIIADDVKIHVVGTSFNVKSSKDQTEVIVETGIVSVGIDGKTVQVLPKQKVIVRKRNTTLEIQKSMDSLYSYYRTKAFVCNNTPLYQLVDALNNAYDAKITITNNSIRNLRLTTTFKEMSLNDILKVITETFNIQIEQRNGEIILK